MTNKQSWESIFDEKFDWVGWKYDEEMCKSYKNMDKVNDLKEFIKSILTSKAEQIERETIKIPTGKHTGKSWCPQCEDEGFNAGISKAIEILKK